MEEKNMYENGWNVENEYVSSVNEIMEHYNNQLNEINNLYIQVKLNIDDKQIKQWYEQDYVLNNVVASFEKYKQDIMSAIEEKNKKLEAMAEQKFIELKNETQTSLYKIKNELELILSEKRIELSSINLGKQKAGLQYDRMGNAIVPEDLAEFNKKYDSTWLEIRKIEHALDYLKEKLEVMNSLKEKSFISNEIIDEEFKEENESSQEEFNEFDEKIESSNECKNIEEIIQKVCGDKKLSEEEISKYKASNIKVFSKPEKSSNKIDSIAKTIIGVVPKTTMKLYGQSISKESKSIIEKMEMNAMSLTDDELKILLNEYNSRLNFLPKGFEEIVKPRVNLYVFKRLDQINEELNNKLFEIAKCEEIISIEEDEKIVKDSYIKAAALIKSLIGLQLELKLYYDKSQLHSFKSKVKSLKHKLTYAGARFEDAKECDLQVWSKVSGLSQKIEYSLDPKEVVDSYTKRAKLYKEYNKHQNILPEKYIEKLNEFKSKLSRKSKISNQESKRSLEVRNLIESLKAMKAEITEQDVKEIEDLLKSR